VIPVMIELKYSVVETVERGISHRRGIKLEGARCDLIRSWRLQVESQDLPREQIDAAVKVAVAGVRIALDHVAEDVETLGGVDVDQFASHVYHESGIDGGRDSRFHVRQILEADLKRLRISISLVAIVKIQFPTFMYAYL